MKKQIFSILMCLLMALSLLPISALAADSSTTIAGLTITQTAGESGGYSVPQSDYWSNYSGLITIRKAGTYTISGTYDNTAKTTIGPDGYLHSPEEN